MAFTKFSIPKRAPDSRCQARIRPNKVESYCQQTTNGTRRSLHGARGLIQRRWEKAHQAQAALQPLPQTAQERPTNGHPGPNLDTRIRSLSTVIVSLEAKAPLSLEDTKLLGRLNRTLTNLIDAKLRLEQTAQTLVDAEKLHPRALALFDRLILDESLCAAVVEAFGQLLDELVPHNNTNTKSRQEDSPNVA